MPPAMYEVFNLYMGNLSMAVVNLAPMAEKPVLGLDPGWVRLVLEGEGYARHEWPRMIRLLLTVHQARERTREHRG
jgi:hypothetical protein